MSEKEFHTVRGYQTIKRQKQLLSDSLEDYLEMIYRIILENGYARVNQLANKLNVNPSSVSKTLSKLATKGIVQYEKYGIIKLTPEGNDIGAYLLERHNIVTKFFNIVSDNTSEQNFAEAEQAEHILSKSTIIGLQTLLDFLEAHEQQYTNFKKRSRKKDV